ncbi:MAG: hypothetical protein ACLFWD_12775 [Anaerolineales bacterium]
MQPSRASHSQPESEAYSGDRGSTQVEQLEPESETSPEFQEAQHKVKLAKERLLSAAIAFCDGLISAGQLRAVREMLKEKELRLVELDGQSKAPFHKDEPKPAPTQSTGPAVEQIPPKQKPFKTEDQPAEKPRGPINNELEVMLAHLDEKMSRLETEFQQGRINASQYRAIRRHYVEQREVAVRLHQTNPSSDRWRVVLEEGKTSFLMQLNEAECRCIAFYDIDTRDCIFVQGELPSEAEEAMRFLSTFGQPAGKKASGRMFATQTDDGLNLLLIPGGYVAALVAFSDEPPGWQVRAIREVLRNFEAANHAMLERGERNALVFPNLDRFFRS